MHAVAARRRQHRTAAVKQSLAAVQASHPKTAARTRAALSVVFNYAKANGLRAADDPASQATFKFLTPPPPKSIPHRMLPPKEVPGFYAQLITRDSTVSLGLAFVQSAAWRTSQRSGCSKQPFTADFVCHIPVTA
jgi:hypothetical protein